MPPTLLSVVPNRGSNIGGTAVTLLGTDFPAGGTIAVTFDGVPATGVTYISATEIQAVTPPGTAGAVTVCVTFEQTIPVGSIAFSGYGDFYMKFASFDGTIYPPPPNHPFIGQAGEQVGCNGLRALAGANGYATLAYWEDPVDPDIWTTAYALNTEFEPTLFFNNSVQFGPGNTGMTVDAAGNVYACGYAYPNYDLYRLNPMTGVRTKIVTALAPSATGRISMGVSPDGTWFYWSETGSSIFATPYVPGVIKKRNLVTNTDFGVWLTSPNNESSICNENAILVLSNGDVIVAFRNDNDGLRRYNAAGVEQRRYTIPGSGGFGGITVLPDVDRSVSPAPDIETSFVVHYYGGDGTYGTSVARFKTDDGTLLGLLEDIGGAEPAKDGDIGWFEWDGPICLTRVPIACGTPNLAMWVAMPRINSTLQVFVPKNPNAITGGTIASTATAFNMLPGLQLNDETALIRRTTGLPSNASDYTCCFWFEALFNPNFAQTQILFAHTNWNGSTYNQFVKIRSDYDSAGAVSTYQVLAVSGAPSTPNVQAFKRQLYHIAYTRTGTQHRFYRNGVQIQSPSTSNISGLTFTEIVLGNDHLSTVAPGLRFAEWREWTAALTQTQIAAERASHTVVRTANLFTDTPLKTDLLDISGNNHHWSGSGDYSFGVGIIVSRV